LVPVKVIKRDKEVYIHIERDLFVVRSN